MPFPAAADVEELAGQPAGLVGGQEHDDVGDVLRPADPPERRRKRNNGAPGRNKGALARNNTTPREALRGSPGSPDSSKATKVITSTGLEIINSFASRR